MNSTHKDLTNLMIFSHQISSVHVKNMESYPFIYFNGVKEVKLDYNIGTKKGEPTLVSYDLILTEENDNLDKRYLGLQTAIRSLFWKEARIEVKINGKEVYKSE